MSKAADVSEASLAGAWRRIGGPVDTVAAHNLIARVLEDWRAEELPDVGPEDLAHCLDGLWKAGVVRARGSHTVRIRPALGTDDRPLGFDLLEVLQDDRPFLVESVMGEVADNGAEVCALFHPIVGFEAGRASLIQVWLTPLDEARKAALLAGVEATLADVAATVEDFPAMLGLLARTMAAMEDAEGLEPAQRADAIAFLRWLEGGHFVFLGARIYDYPRLPDGSYAAEEPLILPEAGLGVLRDDNRPVLRRANEPAVLSPALRRTLRLTEPVVVAKANLRARVHRRVFADYVGVRRYGPDGLPAGEVRFVGLFTSEAYDEPLRETPLLARKVETVMAAAGFPARSHNARRLANILEGLPRDELFQMSSGELLETARGILHLMDRPRVKLFLRRDPWDRFVSVFFYAPRDRYDAKLRVKVGELVAAAYNGSVTSFTPSFADSALTRVHYVVEITPGMTAEPDLSALEAAAARAARTWDDQLETLLRQAGLPSRTWAGAFSAGYQDAFAPEEALEDVRELAALGEGDTIRVRAYRTDGDGERVFRCKMYRRSEEPAALSRMMPILQDMGVSPLCEDAYPVMLEGRAHWVHEFQLDVESGEHLDFTGIKGPFEAAFPAIWAGAAESDRFNRLILQLGLDIRHAALVRALARCRQQSGLDPSPAIQMTAATGHPDVIRLILDLFEARLKPGAAGDEAAIFAAIEAALQAVESLDEDRVLRRMALLVRAIQRTNFYQIGAEGAPKPYISFKVASRELADLPAPKPFREIYVSGPNVEGVHLRFGPVARGGLRWSDRRDDFRTEVLGLVKAQQVKNAVIVPVGSKGGFFPKNLPRDRAAAQDVAKRAYRTFLQGLLDITDNLDAAGRVVHPADTVIHDGEDPYLVVAADKGTATFSDIANGIAAEYGFWLGDAFASGGSVGYDHKAMGITARGAWESVKRHFREMGVDVQTQSVTVAGVGDMSGDVFGNGVLLSKAIKLVAAFDHRDIFIDPNPDPALSWAERRRMFDLPTSSWAAYDPARISKGGGVFSRSLKSIPLSDEMRVLLDLKTEAATPNEVITAILKSRVDLLYLGGIGCYVKSATESHLDVGDKANDGVRINGADLRCKVVGEGANLGFTQAGRIEFARRGGRINTDAIDNSAGVDTSDHEVNIKILLGAAQAARKLAPADRPALLASMTDAVAEHVLAHNYDQNLTLSMLQAGTADALEAQGRFMTDLERRGRLDRALEGLPDAAALAERARLGQGLTRPELAVLLAYGKLDLFDDLAASTGPDDPHFQTWLRGYFPAALSDFAEEMDHHRLRREIVATRFGNWMVNTLGPTFPTRLRASAGCDTAALAIGCAAAAEVLRINDHWDRIKGLDGLAPPAAQIALYRETAAVLRGLIFWLSRLAAHGGHTVQSLTDHYRPAVDVLKAIVPSALSTFEQKAAVRRAESWIKAGAPRDIAHSIALLRPLTLAVSLSDLAMARTWGFEPTARLYHRVGGQFGFDRLRAAAGALGGKDRFERLAVRRLIEDLAALQSRLTGAVMGETSEDEAAREALTLWISRHAGAVREARRNLEDVEKAPGGWTFAKLTIATGALRELADGA
jgi:glutamate dehydrogenase